MLVRLRAGFGAVVRRMITCSACMTAPAVSLLGAMLMMQLHKLLLQAINTGLQTCNRFLTYADRCMCLCASTTVIHLLLKCLHAGNCRFHALQLLPMLCHLRLARCGISCEGLQLAAVMLSD